MDTVKGGLEKIRDLFPFSPAKEGPFSGHGYTTYSGRALMTSFGEGIGVAASSVVSSTKSALSDVQALFGAKSLAFAADASVTGNIAARRATPNGGYSMLSIGNLSVDAGGIRDEEVVNAINPIVGYARRTAGAM